MTDLRGYKEVIRESVARERRCDQNWSWKVHSVGKEVAKIAWGYLDYLQEKDSYFEVRLSEDEEIGCVVTGVAPNGYKVILFIGDKPWDDFKSWEEGIACAIHSVALYAHSVY